MISFRVKINLRWPLRLVCRFIDHDVEQVHSLHPLMGDGFLYCRRCGDGWMHNGYRKCWLPFQHQWSDEGEPSVKVATQEPFRQIQRCPRCNECRVIECATGEAIHA